MVIGGGGDLVPIVISGQQVDHLLYLLLQYLLLSKMICIKYLMAICDEVSMNLWILETWMRRSWRHWWWLMYVLFLLYLQRG